MTGEHHYKACELDEGDSGIGKGSLCSDESTSLVSEGSNSLDKNEKPPKYGYPKRSVIAARLASAGTYSCTYLGGKPKKQDRERLTGRETWNDIRTVGIMKEKRTVYHTLEPEICEEDNSCSDDISCDSDNVTTSSSGDKPKAYPYAKVKLDQNSGMFYGSDNRYGVFPVQPWERPGSTEYGSLASSTMTLSSSNGYDRLDRNCRKHQQGDPPSTKPCRHRDVEQQLAKMKLPPPPLTCPKPARIAPPPPLSHHSGRLTPPIPGRISLAAFQRQSNVSSEHSMRDSTSNASINSENTLTPPPSPHQAHQQLLNVNQEYKRFLGGSLGNVSVRSDGYQINSGDKPSYTKFVGSSSWNDVSTIENQPPKPSKVPLIRAQPALYSTVSRENVTELTNKLNGLITPTIFVENSKSNLNNDPPYTTVMRVSSSASDVSSISDGKLTPPPQTMHGKTDHTYGSVSDISETSDDRYMNSFSARNTGDFSDIDLSTPRNTKDFSDIELVNLSSESLKMDTRYSFASGSSYAYS